MSKNVKPMIMTNIPSVEALDAVLEEMRNQGFFGILGSNEKNKYSEELIADARQKILGGASEVWFSNTVDELKILTGLNGVKIYNFNLSNRDSIRAIQAAATLDSKSD